LSVKGAHALTKRKTASARVVKCFILINTTRNLEYRRNDGLNSFPMLSGGVT
jgi:hypothetical protein